MKIKNYLEEMGFYTLENALSELCQKADLYTAQAGKSGVKEAFEAFPSYIPTSTPIDRNDLQLIVDIGGTSTKVALRDTRKAGTTWTILFEEKNDDLRPAKIEKTAFQAFSSVLAKKISEELKKINEKPSEVAAAAFVWSNAITNKPMGSSGISAFVTRIREYKKGEWFIADLSDGEDLGATILNELKANGFNLKQFLITNDASLTMKAVPHADGGMVAATGLNGTVVKNLSDFGENQAGDIICNGEIGGKFDIDKRYLSAGDWITSNARANTIELLSAGKFIPALFTAHIIELARSVPELKDLTKYLRDTLKDKRWAEYRSKDVGLLIDDQPGFLARRSPDSLKFYTPEVLSTLAELARAIYIRSGKLCAVVAYATIANQFQKKDSFLVALDSRLAREVPVFNQAFFETISKITPENKEINVQLVSPLNTSAGPISVPMQGAAYALDSLGL